MFDIVFVLIFAVGYRFLILHFITRHASILSPHSKAGQMSFPISQTDIFVNTLHETVLLFNLPSIIKNAGI